MMLHITELPQEVLLETFSYLDYSNLKKCMRVNRTFKTFLQQSAFDKTLFRSKNVLTEEISEPLPKLHLHPFFDSLNHLCGNCCSKAEEVLKLDCNDPIGEIKNTLLINNGASNEHATEPPVNVLYIQIGNSKPMKIRKKSGVTVSQVMKKLWKSFAKKHKKSSDRHFSWDNWDEIRSLNGKFLLFADCGHYLIPLNFFQDIGLLGSPSPLSESG